MQELVLCARDLCDLLNYRLRDKRFAKSQVSSLYANWPEVRQDKFSIDAAKALAEFPPRLLVLQEACGATGGEGHLSRAWLMRSTASLFEMVESMVAPTCQNIIFPISLDDYTTPPSHWVHRLAQKISCSMDARVPNVILRSDEFLGGIVPVTFFEINLRAIRYSTLTDASMRYYSLVDLVRRAVLKFLQIPTEPSYDQGRFVSLLSHEAGTEAILLLPATWKAFLSVHTQVYRTGKDASHIVPNTRISSFLKELHQHPCLRDKTPERAVLEHLHWLELTLRHPHKQIDYDYERLLAVYASVRPNDPTIAHLQPLHADVVPVSVWGAKLKAYLDATEEILDSPLPEHPGALSAQILGDIDYYSPFRERAPTLAHQLEPGGPLSDEFKCTVEGFRSELICRGVTFGTTTGQKGPLIWYNWNHFVEYAGPLPSEEVYKPNAYGTYMAKRNKYLAATYFTDSQRWPGFLAGRTSNIPCEELFDFLTATPISPGSIPEQERIDGTFK